MKKISIHPLTVRITHWLNAVAILIMVTSGWRIYNASPLFAFEFPDVITLGGWLAGALLWHFAAMWLLVVNGLVYLAYGLLSGHYRRDFLPVSAGGLFRGIGQALRGHLAHVIGEYNVVQRTAYPGIIVTIILTVLSGLAIWKPVPFHLIATTMGGYDGARLVHFFCMAAIVLFVLIHIVMVVIVPKTFLPMITGRTPHSGSSYDS
jgi:thiosulfate reductase cytochrome b subunit